VFYTEAMVADSRSFSPSAAKPRAVVASWRERFGGIVFREPSPATTAQLEAAHDRDYVRGVLAGTRPNGFGNTLTEVTASLPYTSGAMIAAARAARESGVAVAPVAGFHHAGYAQGGGFCTFNGLLVAALALRHDTPTVRVGILDCDHHYGDGTTDIIRHLRLDWVQHYSVGATYDHPAQAAGFFEQLPAIVRAFRACDVLLYQAGADPHVQDPLGGWLTTDELRERDRIVFVECKRAGLPVAWNLAGGYQTPLRRVLDVHDNTMAECIDVFGGTDRRASG
jgi:acetoin utilization deacetylase AcuC-like enzyme